MNLNFEWDEHKAKHNLQRHPGVSFNEAKTVFDDEFSININDSAHSPEEERFIDLGRSEKGHILVVVYTERGNNIRIISARKPTPTEKI